MSSRYGFLALLSLGLACQLGCCGWNWGPAGSPCERTWCGSQCGCRVWSEWFSFPPMCRDNCSCCADFTASNNPYVLNGPSEARFGPIYDDGGPRASARMYEQNRGSMQPTPATRQEQPEAVPTGEPMTKRRSNQVGRTDSYDHPIDSQRSSRKLGRPPYRYVR
jgi:hypothetical protein